MGSLWKKILTKNLTFSPHIWQKCLYLAHFYVWALSSRPSWECERRERGRLWVEAIRQSMLNFVKCLVYQVGKVQLSFCSLSIVESVWGGRRRIIWPMGGRGALKPIRPYREPFSQGPHQQEEGHVHTEIYCSRGYKYSWPYLVALGKCLLPCFPQCSL